MLFSRKFFNIFVNSIIKKMLIYAVRTRNLCEGKETLKQCLSLFYVVTKEIFYLYLLTYK